MSILTRESETKQYHSELMIGRDYSLKQIVQIDQYLFAVKENHRPA